jgi:hypothetical protein
LREMVVQLLESQEEQALDCLLVFASTGKQATRPAPFRG